MAASPACSTPTVVRRFSRFEPDESQSARRVPRLEAVRAAAVLVERIAAIAEFLDGPLNQESVREALADFDPSMIVVEPEWSTLWQEAEGVGPKRRLWQVRTTSFSFRVRCDLRDAHRCRHQLQESLVASAVRNLHGMPHPAERAINTANRVAKLLDGGVGRPADRVLAIADGGLAFYFFGPREEDGETPLREGVLSCFDDGSISLRLRNWKTSHRETIPVAKDIEGAIIRACEFAS